MIGAGFFMLTSYTFLNKDESQLEKIVYTFFTLIESGTGGFTIHQTLPLSNTLLVIIIITMFVGGNTGSTAGGFGAGKTGYLFLTLKHGVSGSNAAGQIAIRLLLISAVIILLLTMGIHYSQLETSWFKSLFIAVSTFSNVGFEFEVTELHTDKTAWIIIAGMASGKIGLNGYMNYLLSEKVKQNSLNYLT